MPKIHKFIHKIKPWYYVPYDKAIVKMFEGTGMPDRLNELYFSNESEPLTPHDRNKWLAYCLRHYLKGFNFKLYGDVTCEVNGSKSIKRAPINIYYYDLFSKDFKSAYGSIDAPSADIFVKSKDLNKIIKHINKTVYYSTNPRPY